MAGRVRDTFVRVARRDTKRPRRSSAARAGATVGELIGVDPAAYVNRKVKRAVLRMIKGEARVGAAVTAEDLPDNKDMRRRVTRVRDHLEKQLQEWAEQLLPPRAQSSPAFSIAADESPTVTAGRKRPAPTNLAAATAAVAAAPAPKKRRRGKGGKRAAPTHLAVARAARAAAHTTSVPTDADDDDEDMGDVPLRVLGKRSVSPVDHFVAGPTGRRDSLGLGRTNYQRIGRSVDEKQAIEQATHKAQERKALEDAATDRATRIIAGSYRTINSNLVHTAVIPTINKPKLLLLHILHVGGGSFQARLDDSTLRECLTLQVAPKSRNHNSITSFTTPLRKKLLDRFSIHAPHPKL